MANVALYAYAQPYRKLYINLLEIVVLVDLLLLLMITSADSEVIYHCVIQCSYYLNFTCRNLCLEVVTLLVSINVGELLQSVKKL